MKKLILPIAVLAGFIVLAMIVMKNPPESKRGRPSQAPQLNVDVQTIVRKNFPIVVDSYGTVKPRTQSALLPQVSGQIIDISKDFRDGGFFEKGEVLVTLDDRDLKAEVKIAQANLLSAKQAYSEEQARVEQAKQDWQRLGNSATAPDLVLRKPQLMAAEAKVFSAQASLDKAKLAVERTKILAPFSGRVLNKQVDIGQLVSPSTRLAEIYAVDYVEIRLPLKNKDLPYMALPESTRLNDASEQNKPLVTFESGLIKGQYWTGRLVRTEGAYDENSQQLYVVAQIDDPYGVKTTKGMPLKIGQYVSAKINGKTVDQVITVPNKAIYQGSYVYIVENDLLMRKNIDIAWQNEQVAIIEQGLEAGQLLVLTPLGQVTSGTPVAINEKDGTIVTQNLKKRGMNKQGKEGKERRGKDKADKTQPQSIAANGGQS